MSQPSWNPTTGIYSHVEMQDYLDLDALSSGICHTLLSQSPAHARYRQLHPTASTPAMDLGTVAHQLLLEGNENRVVLVAADDWRTKAAREGREAAYAAGRLPLLAKTMDEVRVMVDVANAFIETSEISGVFAHGDPEMTLVWDEGNVRCKARPDWLSESRSVIVHFKTTGSSANPETFRDRLVEMGYDLAAAFYDRALRNVTGRDPSRISSVFLIQETSAPYACSLMDLAPSLKEIAVVKVEHAIQAWTQCVSTQHWPAYPTRTCYIEARSWQITRAAEDALAWNDHEAYERLIELGGGQR